MNTTAQSRDTILTFAWQGSTPYQVDEKLAIYGSGEVRYWSMQPAPTQRQDRAGTFSFAVSEAERNSAIRLTEALTRVNVQAEPPDRYNIDYRASLIKDNQLRSYKLPPGDTSLTDARKEIGQLGMDLRKRAEAHPYAAIKIVCKTPPQPIVAGQPASLFFMLENKGSQTVNVSLGSGHLSIFGSQTQSERGQLWWQGPLQDNTIGLTDAEGDLLDGIYASALIRSASTARAFMKDILKAPTNGQFFISVRLEGHMNSPAPDQEPALSQTAQARFIIHSAPITIQVQG